MHLSTPTPNDATQKQVNAEFPVLWVELPAPREIERESWYDPAALYEEPERWDGMA
jgi:hypothetical protein